MDSKKTQYSDSPVPVGKACEEDLKRQAGYFSDEFLAKHLMDALPTVVAIVNEHRQIVYANRSLLDLVGLKNVDALQGLRPGEALNCSHAIRFQEGCGGGDVCRTCGAVLSVLTALSGKPDERAYRISRCFEGRSEAIDFTVRTTPLSFQGENFSVFALTDVSHEKRRTFLERIFFHDVLNVVGSIRGFAELLRSYKPENKEEIFELIHLAAERTIEEIEAQRALLAAEQGDLNLNLESLSSRFVLESQVNLYRRHEVANGKTLLVDPSSQDMAFVSDRALLGRVLGNMIKNALEASSTGDAITLGCHPKGEGQIAFWVHNPGVMSEEARLQVFNRSFSTKGPARGLGTYSMKLLSDYLGGEVDFISTENRGTIFTVTYPLTGPGHHQSSAGAPRLFQ